MEPLHNVFCAGDGAIAKRNPATPASHNPTPVSTPQWGLLRQSRSLQALLRIPPSRTDPSNDSNTEDTPCTLDIAASSADKFPSDAFPGWARARRTQITFDGAGGVSTLGRQEVSRVERITLRSSAAARAPRVTLMKLIEGYLPIPATIGTPRVSIRCPREALYVPRMYRYLSIVDDDLLVTTFPIILHLPGIRRDAHGVSKPEIRPISLYSPSVSAGCLMLLRDYEALRNSCAAADDNYHQPKPFLETLLLMKNP